MGGNPPLPLRNFQARRKRPMKSLIQAATVLVAIGSAVAQEQPQKPKLHGFKARLCALSTVRDSPAFDNRMARGFRQPRPSQPPQQAPPPPAKPEEPIAAKADPAQAKPREQIAAKADPVQAKPQEPIAA